MNTTQRQRYETAYALIGDDDYGIPDRKIADGTEMRGKRILCLGCGAGTDVWYLAKDNDVTGLDYAASGLEVAEKHDIHAVQSDLNANPILPFDRQSFDVIVCKDILEHLLDPLAVLREVSRVLRHDGYAIISVPNHFSFGMRMRLLLGKGIIYKSLLANHQSQYNEWNYMHIRFFTFKGFRRFLGDAGFRAEKWFWDFGNLAHYFEPGMWIEPQLRKIKEGLPVSRRGKLGLYLLRPAWLVFNAVFPRRLRSLIVSVCPGLLCGGFYVRCRKA